MLKELEIVKCEDKTLYSQKDTLAKEVPFKVIVEGKLIATTMRTPDKDEDLATGICFTYGIIKNNGEILSISIKNHTATIQLNKKFEDPHRVRKEENLIDGLEKRTSFNSLKVEDLFRLRDDFVNRMKLFKKTGCVHASALFDKNLNMLAFAEDVGRHNALDKVIGKVLREKKEKNVFLCLMSSRLSFEIFQKAARIGAEILVGISAPTHLAVEHAKKLNMTLVGFLRDRRMNIYSYPERVIL